MTHKILKTSMKGDIAVSNERFLHDELLYEGACFKITLPIQ